MEYAINQWLRRSIILGWGSWYLMLSRVDCCSVLVGRRKNTCGFTSSLRGQLHSCRCCSHSCGYLIWPIRTHFNREAMSLLTLLSVFTVGFSLAVCCLLWLLLTNHCDALLISLEFTYLFITLVIGALLLIVEAPREEGNLSIATN